MARLKERTCIICGEKDNKPTLLRWVVAENRVIPDWTQKLPGRSVYTHYEKECVAGIYETSKVSRKLLLKNPEYVVSRKEIFDHIGNLAVFSLGHFFSLGTKSGVMVKGQNLLEESVKKGSFFKECYVASDVSERTLKNMEQIFQERLIKTVLTKTELGQFADGRPLGVVAFMESEIAGKVSFYIKLVNKFRSGDIDAY